MTLVNYHACKDCGSLHDLSNRYRTQGISEDMNKIPDKVVNSRQRAKMLLDLIAERIKGLNRCVYIVVAPSYTISRETLYWLCACGCMNEEEVVKE